MTDLLLGLIGDNIAASRAPVLHRLAGAQVGVEVRYDRLVPAELGKPVEQILRECAAAGYRGVNVTYPYKEQVAQRVTIADPQVRAIGAVNTVMFGASGMVGENTDYTGFMAAYRATLGTEPPGRCALIGCGGVGRALAFALLALGAEEIRLFDRDMAKAHGLARDLLQADPARQVTVASGVAQATQGADGLLNGTPLGMVGIGGTPVARDEMAGARWVFDAVYTPVETPFLRDAAAAGLAVLPGYELFFYQGVHAWRHFSGMTLDEDALRQALAAA
ncbi:shikimate dehydrogenase family protein [Pseudoponticoccus marisrubri]|nr:shikimate dehydrogenase [Pseudoponticoccus marisrubri]